MFGFSKGESVRISGDSYPEEGTHSFVGQVGKVSGYVGEMVIVEGLSGCDATPSGSKYGFGPEEIERA
ncbi:hypothetical protein [Streptomyces sp. NRRL S-495]|uniref:hypothetical protein n=1 Tax=Streptomyces sp. NRRL S-495 TaxID=1609133 RepID=UPI0005F96BAE|nr:hypothetical protein [Streptomyces sp. NRRL S-495]KJY32153.1 hypothetical protein VR45_23335 [Streptomyces sp. NRRL S-495]